MKVNMLCVTLTLVLLLVCNFVSPNNSDVEVRSVYVTPETIISQGYHAERHQVITSDGYILEMHRIPFRRGEGTGDRERPVVFIMHGLLGASSGFIALGPENAIAYNLADSGFDVWMGNARGTRNSRFHIHLNPDKPDHRPDFFDFSWEDIGMIDIPTMVDYVLEHTGKKKLHYLGHSQGGTVFLVLNSMRPEYNKKFASVNLMAGVGYMEFFPHNGIKILARFTNLVHDLLGRIGLFEFFPPISLNRTRDGYDLEHSIEDMNIKDIYDATGLTELMEPYLRNSLNLSLFGGASTKQFALFGQNIRDKTFKRWDFGTARNIEVYGDEIPPSFNLSLITAKVTMHYTVNDELLDERDVLSMVKDMPNAEAKKIARQTFEHSDFILSPDVRELVTEYIIKDIMKVEGIYPSEKIDETDGPSSSGASNTIRIRVFKAYFISFIVYKTIN